MKKCLLCLVGVLLIVSVAYATLQEDALAAKAFAQGKRDDVIRWVNGQAYGYQVEANTARDNWQAMYDAAWMLRAQAVTAGATEAELEDGDDHIDDSDADAATAATEYGGGQFYMSSGDNLMTTGNMQYAAGAYPQAILSYKTGIPDSAQSRFVQAAADFILSKNDYTHAHTDAQAAHYDYYEAWLAHQ